MSDFKAKCTKIKFGWGFAPEPTGEPTALPRPLAAFKEPTSKGRGRVGREGEEKGREGREGRGPRVYL